MKKVLLSLCLMSAFAMPKNLDLSKAEVVSYVKSGAYELDQWQAVNEAIWYLKHHSFGQQSAIVFDIDETLLSNFKDLQAYNFGGNARIYIENERKAHGAQIQATKHLFDLALAKGLSIFLITGRPLIAKKYTEKNLIMAGFSGYKDIIMWHGKKPMTISDFKSQARCEIQKQGYKILINVGDQASDLVGQCTGDIKVKLPNPFYLLSADHIKPVVLTKDSGI